MVWGPWGRTQRVAPGPYSASSEATRRSMSPQGSSMVRLIEDHCVDCRQEIANGVVAHREIGEEEVMIDDDDIRGLGLAPCLEDKTIGEARALGP